MMEASESEENDYLGTTCKMTFVAFWAFTIAYPLRIDLICMPAGKIKKRLLLETITNQLDVWFSIVVFY